MVLAVSVICAGLVVVPLVALAVLARGALGRMRRLQRRSSEVQPYVDDLTRTVTGLRSAVTAVRRR